MASNHAFATIRRARSLRERHPDAPPSVVLVALALATYANGNTGTSIRPGFDRLAGDTGLSRSGVKNAVRWLEDRGELRRDKQGHRGSAACFTYLGVAVEGEASPDAEPEPKGPPPCGYCGGPLEVFEEAGGYLSAACAAGCHYTTAQVDGRWK